MRYVDVDIAHNCLFRFHDKIHFFVLHEIVCSINDSRRNLFFFWNYVTIFRAKRDCMLWLHSCLIMSLFCFCSYFKSYEFASSTISKLSRNCDFYVCLFNWRKENHKSSSNRWYVAQSLISRLCRKCLKKQSICTF